MRRKIFTIGNPTQWNVLTRDCAPVKTFDRHLRRLIRDLFETMYAENGLGLAAPQLGKSIQVCVLDVLPRETKVGKPIVLVNPEITSQSGLQIDEEGCLSIPNLRVQMERPYTLTVSYQTEDGSPPRILGAEGLLARVICHEVDHLRGRLITDYVFERALAE